MLLHRNLIYLQSSAIRSPSVSLFPLQSLTEWNAELDFHSLLYLTSSVMWHRSSKLYLSQSSWAHPLIITVIWAWHATLKPWPFLCVSSWAFFPFSCSLNGANREFNAPASWMLCFRTTAICDLPSWTQPIRPGAKGQVQAELEKPLLYAYLYRTDGTKGLLTGARRLWAIDIWLMAIAPSLQG